MAINAATVWEVRTTGAQTNGAGFADLDPGTSVDYSQQDAAQLSLADATTDGAGTGLGSATGGFTAAMAGNVVYLTGGTATAGWYQITAYTSTNLVTIDRSAGLNKSGVTANVGGAFLIGGALDDAFFEAKAAGNTIWIGSGTFTLGGAVSIAVNGTAALPFHYEGYNAARGDNPTGDNRPLIDLGGNTFITADYTNWRNLRFTGAGTGLNGAVRPLSWSNFSNCKFHNTTSGGTALNGGSNYVSLVGCEIIAYNGTGVNLLSYGSHSMRFCYVHDCSIGVQIGAGMEVNNCIIDTCQTGVDCSSVVSPCVVGSTIRNCITGISGTTSSAGIFVNNIIANCVTGASWTTATLTNLWDYNCWSNNDTDVSNVTKGDNDVTADALLGSGIAEGTDGATDAGGTVFTAASNPFGSVTTSDCLNIIEAGTGATLGVYGIASVDGAGQLTLARSAGASKTGIDYRIVLGTDFTLRAGSPAGNAGLDASLAGATV